MATIESNRMATIYTDNRSWAPSFVLLGSTKGTTPGAPSASSEEVPPGVEALRKALLPQVLRVIDLFRKLDANGDGKVTGVEFRRVLPLLASSASEAESFGEADVDSLFALLDRDGSGSIEYSELHARLRQGLSVALDKKLQAGAVGFDLEAKNRLSTYTLRGAADAHECQEASSAPADAPAAKVKSSDLGPYVAAQQMDLCRRRHEQASPERLRRLASNHPPQQPTHLGG
eukprot:jgi/Chrpa1/14258/Chrysochromulina_OHIO_Genome00022386-RA